MFFLPCSSFPLLLPPSSHLSMAVSTLCCDFPSLGVLCYSRSHQRRLELFGACWQSSVSRQLKRLRPGTRDEDCTVIAYCILLHRCCCTVCSRPWIFFKRGISYTSVYICFDAYSITLFLLLLLYCYRYYCHCYNIYIYLRHIMLHY